MINPVPAAQRKSLPRMAKIANYTACILLIAREHPKMRAARLVTEDHRRGHGFKMADELAKNEDLQQ
jgi:hypothetical protein